MDVAIHLDRCATAQEHGVLLEHRQCLPDQLLDLVFLHEKVFRWVPRKLPLRRLPGVRPEQVLDDHVRQGLVAGHLRGYAAGSLGPVEQGGATEPVRGIDFTRLVFERVDCDLVGSRVQKDMYCARTNKERAPNLRS